MFNLSCFVARCCGIDKETGRLGCTEDLAVEWIDGLYVLIAVCRVACLLFAPLFLQWFFYPESIQKTDYLIRLKDHLTKTLLVKRVRFPFLCTEQVLKETSVDVPG